MDGWMDGWIDSNCCSFAY